MKRLRTTRRMIVITAAATLALSGAAVTTADAAAPEKHESAKGRATKVVNFGAYTDKIVVDDPKDPEDRDPTVDATNNTLAVSPNEKLAVATNSYSDHLVVINVWVRSHMALRSPLTVPCCSPETRRATP